MRNRVSRLVFYLALVATLSYLAVLPFTSASVKANQWDNYYWADTSLLWWGDSTALNNLVSGAMTQVQNSAAEWDSSNTGADIDWAETSSQGDSDVDVVTVDFDVTGWGTIPGKASLGLNGWTIIYAAAYLNSDPPNDGGFTWYTDGTMDETNKKADVRTITVHEMGHTLALDHDCSPDTQVMCVTWTQKWYVTTADKNELKAIYGP